MSIVQTIRYDAPYDYFGGFIQNAIDETDVNASVSRTKEGFELVIDEEDPQKLERFSLFLQKYLPHSIFLKAIDTKQADKKPAAETFSSETYAIAPCPICLEKLTDPASQEYLSDTIVCTHYANEADESKFDPTLFSPHFHRNDTILLCNPEKVHDLFHLTEQELKTLMSIEKPVLKLTLKDETLKETVGRNYCHVQAPYNIKSALAALNAKESGIDTLFFNRHPTEPEAVVVQDHICLVRDNRLTPAPAAKYSDAMLDRFDAIAKEAGYESALGAYMSQNGIAFGVMDKDQPRKAIAFQPFDWPKVYAAMQDNPTRTRLLENYFDKFPLSKEQLQNHEGDVFGLLAKILQLENPGFEALSDAALTFRGNGGLKIDMFFSDEGFDYAAMVGSVMSFRLAGAEPHYLAYSIFEAYGDMAVSVLGQLKRKFKIENFILFGDMFENGVLFSRILSKFQISTPYFPKAIALDGNSLTKQ